jgi:NAD-dependent DNA ligase
MPSTIANAIPILEELNNILDKAYWEANSLNVKDAIYDCLSSVNKELSELSKLSIQDHDMPYEPISGEFKIATQRLSLFRKYLDNHIMRNSTLTRLESVTATLTELITPDHDSGVK